MQWMWHSQATQVRQTAVGLVILLKTTNKVLGPSDWLFVSGVRCNTGLERRKKAEA
jgi:hypothetical protein